MLVSWRGSITSDQVNQPVSLSILAKPKSDNLQRSPVGWLPPPRIPWVTSHRPQRLPAAALPRTRSAPASHARLLCHGRAEVRASEGRGSPKMDDHIFLLSLPQPRLGPPGSGCTLHSPEHFVIHRLERLCHGGQVSREQPDRSVRRGPGGDGGCAKEAHGRWHGCRAATAARRRLMGAGTGARRRRPGTRAPSHATDGRPQGGRLDSGRSRSQAICSDPSA